MDVEKSVDSEILDIPVSPEISQRLKAAARGMGRPPEQAVAELLRLGLAAYTGRAEPQRVLANRTAERV